MTVMSHVFPTQVVHITKETKGKKGIVYTDGGGRYVCTKGLLDLRFSMSEASESVLLQGGVKNLQGKIHLELRTAVFQRLHQFLTEDPPGSCILVMVRRCNFGLQSGSYQECSGFVKKSTF